MRLTELLGIVFLFSMILLSMFFVGFVSAVAVGGVYSENYPLEMYPGETRTISFLLQNLAGDNDVKFRASVAEGSEIVSIADSNPEYLVPLGSNDILVSVRVEIPKDAVIGGKYDAKIKFEPIPLGTEEEGMVQIALGLSRYFKIRVVEEKELPEELPEKLLEGKPEKISVEWILFVIILVVVIIALIAVIWFVVKRKEASKLSEPVK